MFISNSSSLFFFVTSVLVAICVRLAWQYFTSTITPSSVNKIVQLVSSSAGEKNKKKSKISVLLVFAHPDDEAMFFSPTLHALMNNNKTGKEKEEFEVHFLSVTQGNYDRIGDKREKELHDSAKFYNASSCLVISNDKCLDGPNEKWDQEFVATHIIEKRMKEVNADIVLTFDDYGVSGHKNHKDVFACVQRISKNQQQQQQQEQQQQTSSSSRVLFFKLRSLPIWEKYASVFGVLIRSTFFSSSSSSSSSLTFILPPSQGFLSMRGLWRHQTQFVWFRFFYVLFASYSYENLLEIF